MDERTTMANSSPVVWSSPAIGTAHLSRLLGAWADPPGSLTSLLADALRRLVRSGRIPAGTRLPSERVFAASLGVSRATVGQAFDHLRGDGVLVSRTGTGTFVSASSSHVAVRGEDRLSSYVQPSARIDLRSAAVPGVPFVAEELDALSAAEFGTLLESHGYYPSGLDQLREAIAGYYTDVGLPTGASQILVTSGAQQATRMLAGALLEAGEPVLVEEPTYRGAIEVLRSVGARLIGVPSGSDGIRADAFADALRRTRAKLAFLQSVAQNPTGRVLSEPAKATIVGIADRYGCRIIDDASPLDVVIDGTPPVPLAGFGGDVITVGSASKAFWGGLRVGWVRSTADVVATLATVKSGEDLGTSIPAQALTLRLLARIDEARTYRRSTLALARAQVHAHLESRTPEWSRTLPAGGASFWIQLPTGASATAFAALAGRAGVDVLPGPTFSAHNRLDDWVRIGYAVPGPVLEAGLDRLAQAWETYRVTA